MEYLQPASPSGSPEDARSREGKAYKNSGLQERHNFDSADLISAEPTQGKRLVKIGTEHTWLTFLKNYQVRTVNRRELVTVSRKHFQK